MWGAAGHPMQTAEQNPVVLIKQRTEKMLFDNMVCTANRSVLVGIFLWQGVFHSTLGSSGCRMQSQNSLGLPAHWSVQASVCAGMDGEANNNAYTIPPHDHVGSSTHLCAACPGGCGVRPMPMSSQALCRVKGTKQPCLHPCQGDILQLEYSGQRTTLPGTRSYAALEI